jgi:uncharacterized protein involved in response to NO
VLIQIENGRSPGPSRPIPTLLSFGFRPFFLLAGLYAVGGLLYWLLAYGGTIPTPAPLPAPFWHGREMLFGFAGAAVAGFLLTAVANWTNTPPVRGTPLAVLVGIWIAGRLAWWASGILPAAAVAAADLPFFPLLAWFVAARVVPARQHWNYAFPALLLLLFVANSFVHLEAAGILADGARYGLYGGVYAVVTMITIVGGRVVPSFTGNALRLAGVAAEVRLRPRLDRTALAAVVTAAVLDLVAPGGPASGLAALLAGGLMVARMAGWQTLRTLDRPIVWILHAGYGWIPLGFLVKAAADLGGVLPPSAALHAFTAGAIGTMALALGSRAALGHTGRPIAAPPSLVWAYVLVPLGALIRVGATLLPAAAVGPAIILGGVLWLSGYAVFAAIYLPILTRPRVDGRPG